MGEGFEDSLFLEFRGRIPVLTGFGAVDRLISRGPKGLTVESWMSFNRSVRFSDKGFSSSNSSASSVDTSSVGDLPVFTRKPEV